MSYQIWLEDREKSVEGHTMTLTLYVNDTKVVGPFSCHDNAVELQKVLAQVDPRVKLVLNTKAKTVEGHIKSLYIKANGKVVLDGLSVHDNMGQFVTSLSSIWAAFPPS
ncbi:hypothetical protein PspLS_09396 [Pyricularia sp. CBS 133598]|nr:hypothetical protein PspLS_09396 [Pyricularia sp. CBS 133598]